MKKTLLTSIAFTTGALIASAQLAEFNATGTSTDFSATNIASDLTASDITSAGGLDLFFVDDTNDQYTVSSVAGGDGTLATAVAANSFFTITLTADAGFKLDLANITFNVGKGGGSGTRNWGLYSSATGGTSGSLLDSITDNSTPSGGSQSSRNISLAAAEFQDLSSITFQFVTATNASFREFDWKDITINGTAVAVPEPSSYALVSGALALGWIMVRRRR